MNYMATSPLLSGLMTRGATLGSARSNDIGNKLQTHAIDCVGLKLVSVDVEFRNLNP